MRSKEHYQKKLAVEAEQLRLFKESTTSSEMRILPSTEDRSQRVKTKEQCSFRLMKPSCGEFLSQRVGKHSMNSWGSVHFPTGQNRTSSSPSTSQRGGHAWRAAAGDQASQSRRQGWRDTRRRSPTALGMPAEGFERLDRKQHCCVFLSFFLFLRAKGT